LRKCLDKWRKDEYKGLIEKNRVVCEENQHKEMEDFLNKKQETQKENDKVMEIQRNEEYKGQSLQYREQNLEKKIKKRVVHKEICKDIMDFILDLSDVVLFFFKF